MVIGLGTIVNAAVIAGCACIGVFVKKGVPERFQNTAFSAIGASVIIIGISGALAGLFRVTQNGTLETVDIMMMLISMVLGGFLGELLRLDKGFDFIAGKFKQRFAKDDDKFTQGLIECSVIFCAGAMGIMGALEDGLMGETSTLFAKSFIDGVTAFIFASVYGAGVLFSAFSVLIYQGLWTLFAAVIRPVVTDGVMLQISLIGSIIIMLIGFNMLGVKKINVINLVPATFIPLFYEIILRILNVAH